jgi:hypothetical protein
MKNNIEIQQEFENLISELTRLKDINELTSSNAENAKKVINEIEGIANSMLELKRLITSDFENKSLIINKLINDLSDRDFNSKLEEEKQILINIQRSANNFQNNILDIKIDDRLYSLYSEVSELKNGINHFQNKLDSLEKSVLSKLDSNESNLSNSILQTKESLNDGFSEFDKKLNNHFKKQNRFSLIYFVILMFFAGTILAIISFKINF